MHRLIAPAVVLLLALATFSGCTCGGLRGSGSARTETRTVAPFQAIAASGSYSIDIAVGNGPSVVVTADDNLLPHVLTTVDAERLSIRTDQVLSPRTDIKVVIQTPTLTAVRVTGSNHATIRGITGDSFRLDVDGASDVRAEGATKRLDLVGSGASSVDTRGLVADSATVRASGAGSYDVFVKSSLDATASGATTINYFGHPATVRKDASGASTIAEK